MKRFACLLFFALPFVLTGCGGKKIDLNKEDLNFVHVQTDMHAVSQLDEESKNRIAGKLTQSLEKEFTKKNSPGIGTPVGITVYMQEFKNTDSQNQIASASISIWDYKTKEEKQRFFAQLNATGPRGQAALGQALSNITQSIIDSNFSPEIERENKIIENLSRSIAYPL